MEFLTIFLSGLLALVAPVGFVADRVIENALRSRFENIEQLQVRVDNAPSYQLLQGKVERVRVAGRGVHLTPDLRLAVLELETDPINLDLQSLRQGRQQSATAAFRQPIQAGVRLVLTQEDINQAIQSPTIAARLKQVTSRIISVPEERFELRNSQVELLGDNRLRFQVQLVQDNAEPVSLNLESGIGIVSGRSIQLIEPVASVNGTALPPQLVAGFAAGAGNRFNLRSLEEAGIAARILDLDITDNQLEIAAFVRADAARASTASPEVKLEP
jgi:hypothetical protein